MQKFFCLLAAFALVGCAALETSSARHKTALGGAALGCFGFGAGLIGTTIDQNETTSLEARKIRAAIRDGVVYGPSTITANAAEEMRHAHGQSQIIFGAAGLAACGFTVAFALIEVDEPKPAPAPRFTSQPSELRAVDLGECPASPSGDCPPEYPTN